MDVGNLLGNAESNSKLSKNVCADVYAASGFFFEEH